jgi:diguanylate cyclase (GGDEF)-like protein
VVLVRMVEGEVNKRPFVTGRYANILLQVLAWCAVVGGLYWCSLYSYILFHSIVEIFSIVVASCIFLIAWNSRRFLDNNYVLFLGISFLFIAVIDIIHALAYKGMGVFQGWDANLPTQLWIAMRYMLAVSFLIAPLFIRRKVNVPLVLAAYAAVTVLTLLSIFYWRIFPACFVEGAGLTPFKIDSEYAISLILLGSLIFLLVERKAFERYMLGLLIGSIVLSIAAEMAFTAYVSVYGFSNMLGHMLILVSFYLIYKAIIETGLTKPFVLLFRNLKRSETELRTLSYIDELTSLYNRRGFLAIAAKQLTISRRTKNNLLLLYADLDGMKWINDTLGHSEGDVALLKAAGVLKNTFRESDIIGRLGGDEFAVLATLANQDSEAVIKERMEGQLDILNMRGSQRYYLSLSIGAVNCSPDETASMEDLLDRADKLMYADKASRDRSKGFHNVFWKG